MTDSNEAKIQPITRHPRAVNHGTAGDSEFSRVEEAISAYRDGQFVIIVDDDDRENEGDLTIAAQFATAEHITFMLNNCKFR